MQTKQPLSIFKKIFTAIFLIIILPFTVLVIIALIKGPTIPKISNDTAGLATTTSIMTTTTVPTTTEPVKNEDKSTIAVTTPEPIVSEIDSSVPHPAVANDFIKGETLFSIVDTNNTNGYVAVNVDVKNFPFKERVLADTGTAAVKIFQQKFTEIPNATGVNVIYKCLELSKTSSCISYYVGKDTYKKVNWNRMFGDELCGYLREEGSKTRDSKCIIVSRDLR
jgi:hypothetical protein